jgi:DNA-binding CsgD family transcriptional regulator
MSIDGAADSLALDMLTRAVAVADSPSTVDQVLLGELGRTWQLDAAALSRVDTRRTVTTSVWPDEVAAGELSTLLNEHGSDIARSLDGSRELSAWNPSGEPTHRHIVVAMVHPVGPQRPPPHGAPRVASFARARPFTESDLSLWAAARQPLAALWGLADRLAHGAYLDPGGATHRIVADEPLTHRETEVLELLADGRLATSIASELGLSPRTVHRHLANIYRKLGVHDRMVAVNVARERGLLGPGPAPSQAVPRPRDRQSREAPGSLTNVIGDRHG